MADLNTPLLSRRKLLGCVIETSTQTLGGTAATVTSSHLAADTTILNATLIPTEFFAEGERMPIGNSLGKVDSVVGRKIGVLRFTQLLRHGDFFTTFIQGCGYTLSGTTASPESDMTARKYLTFALWEDGRKKMIQAANGNCTISFNNGGIATAEWEFTGIWIAPTDDTLPSQSPITSTNYVASGTTLTLGGSAIPHVSSVTIELGNTVVPREDVTRTGGVLCYLVSDRSPTVSLDLEARKISQSDAYGIMAAGTTAALNCVLATGTDTLTIAAPRLQRIDIQDGDRGGKLLDVHTFQCNVSSGDDELTFTES